jgi:hypothetical protein
MARGYEPMKPIEHFAFMYKAKIEPTGKNCAKLDVLQGMSYSMQPQSMMDLEFTSEPEIGITMSTSDFNKFMNGYENYIDLMYAIKDPIVHDMFSKLMMYIKLQK